MDFALGPEEELIRSTVRQYARERVAPRAARLDKEAIFPAEAMRELAELGMLGATVPERYGGSPVSKVAYHLMLEELAWACASTSVTWGVHTSVATTPIVQWGADAVKERFLPRLASGEWLGCFALTEPGAGSDAASIQTTARREGDGYTIDGAKVFITNGNHAGMAIVAAKTDPAAGQRGISLFAVEASTKGFHKDGREHKLGLNGSDTARLSFTDMHVPAENLLGAPGQGFRQLMETLNGSRIGIAAQAVGIAQRAFEEATGYARQRVQFGAPIAQLQAIQFKLADMDVRIEASRLLYLRAAQALDDGALAPEMASRAKVFASETASWVTNQAVQVHGGNGYVTDYPVERLMRDARVTEIYEGTSEVQRIIIARQALRA